MKTLRLLSVVSKVHSGAVASTSRLSKGQWGLHFVRPMSSDAAQYDPKDLFNSNYLGLPRLPIPELDASVERLLETIKPIASEGEYAQIAAEAQEFLDGPGPALDAKLKAIDAAVPKGTYPYSYIQPHWDAMYLGLRCPGPIHMSPFFKLTDDPKPENMDQVKRAAGFIHGFAKWTRKILAGQLEPDLDGKGKPLCSTAFGLMYSSAKVPKPGMDEWFQDQSSRVVTVVSKGNLCSIEVLNEAGELLDVPGIEAQLRHIQSLPPAANAVSMLSMVDRDEWAAMRGKLEEDAGNAAALRAIDAGLLAVCLDDTAPADMSALGQSVLVGPGEQRWADKQQLIAYPNGKMAINFEHSYSDGMGWARFIHEVMSDMEGKDKLPKGVGPLPALPLYSAEDPAAGVTVHQFAVSDEVQAGIAKATAEHAANQASVETQVLEFTDFGKDEIKKWKVSPDAAIQMAYQVAFYGLHEKMPTVYESCATRSFHHGRTETIRSVTAESTAFVSAFYGGTATAAELLNLLRAACAKHSSVSKKAAAGLGCDRHLLSIKKLAEKEGPDAVPALFKNPLYSLSSTFLVSTSNATSTPFIDLFGFGPVSTDGYGFGYLVRGDGINVNVTHFTGTNSKASKEAVEGIGNALRAFQTVVYAGDGSSSDED